MERYWLRRALSTRARSAPAKFRVPRDPLSRSYQPVEWDRWQWHRLQQHHLKRQRQQQLQDPASSPAQSTTLSPADYLDRLPRLDERDLRDMARYERVLKQPIWSVWLPLHHPTPHEYRLVQNLLMKRWQLRMEVVRGRLLRGLVLGSRYEPCVPLFYGAGLSMVYSARWSLQRPSLDTVHRQLEVLRGMQWLASQPVPTRPLSPVTPAQRPLKQMPWTLLGGKLDSHLLGPGEWRILVQDLLRQPVSPVEQLVHCLSGDLLAQLPNMLQRPALCLHGSLQQHAQSPSQPQSQASQEAVSPS